MVKRNLTPELAASLAVACATPSAPKAESFEVGERDARIAELKAGLVQRGDDVIVPWHLYEEINRVGAEWKARAEAAEQDARRLLTESRELALSHLGLLTIYGVTDGVEQTRAHIAAIDACIAAQQKEAANGD